MASLDSFLDQQLIHGRAYFSREEAEKALDLKKSSLSAAITRLIKKRKLAHPRHGFFLILRPEDQASGAPDPANWIDPLLKHQGIDYRISLLRAAMFHGSSHQAAMTFQVIVPKQLRDISIGRHRVQFVYQSPQAFIALNSTDHTHPLKTPAGFAKIAGLELTLLDSIRYFHKAGGINGVAQIVKDIGGKALPRQLANAALHYENASVRRLGYLLELFGHRRQSKALEPFARHAKSHAPLDPSLTPIVKSLTTLDEKNSTWMLVINDTVEIDS